MTPDQVYSLYSKEEVEASVLFLLACTMLIQHRLKVRIRVGAGYIEPNDKIGQKVSVCISALFICWGIHKLLW